MLKLLDNILLLLGSSERKQLDYVLLFGGDKNLAATILSARRLPGGPKRVINNIIKDAWAMGLIDDDERTFLRDYVQCLWTPTLLIYGLTHQKVIRS